jgi:hypothetical protein
MAIRFTIATLVLWRLLAAAPLIQGADFQNLDFESPQLPLIPDSNDPFQRVSLFDALPGWTGYIGTGIEPLANYNSAFLSSAGISLAGPGGWPPFPRFDKNIIAGNFTAFLQSGFDLNTGQDFASASLAQVGTVPAGSLSIQMKIEAGGPFVVSLGGQTLTMLPLQLASNYTLYGADISPFAGQTAELRVTADDPLGPTGLSFLWLDSIGFSTTQVPEPGALSLIALALTALGCYRLIRRSE